MSQSGAAAARKAGQGSGHLGATLRSVLVAPGAGFHAALRTTQRRNERGTRPAEGVTPYVLSAMGGAALMVLWLKIAALVGLRDGSAATYRLTFLVTALGIGAVLGVMAQVVWGWVAPLALRGEKVSRPAARLIWGAAFFPQIFTLLLLLPMDLLITGPSAFTEAKPSDSVGAGWAALSLALGCAFAVWSVALFAKGLGVATGARLTKAAIWVLAAIACTALVGVGFRFALVAVSGGA